MRPCGPICVKCGRHMRVKENGVLAEEMSGSKSYQVWHSDMWECPVCGHQVLTGYGQEPIMEHFQKGYKDFLRKVRTIRFTF